MHIVFLSTGTFLFSFSNMLSVACTGGKHCVQRAKFHLDIHMYGGFKLQLSEHMHVIGHAKL